MSFPALQLRICIHLTAYKLTRNTLHVILQCREMESAKEKLGLHELNLDACEVSDNWRDRLLQLIEKYESIFKTQDGL